MLNGKLTATCALLLVAAALFGCGGEGESTDLRISNPPSDKQSQKPKAAPQSSAPAHPSKSKAPSRSNSDTEEQTRETASDVERAQTPSKPPADEVQQLPACAKGPTSRKCREERNPPPPDPGPAEPPMHGDEPAAESPCKKSSGCGGEGRRG